MIAEVSAGQGRLLNTIKGFLFKQDPLKKPMPSIMSLYGHLLSLSRGLELSDRTLQEFRLLRTDLSSLLIRNGTRVDSTQVMAIIVNDTAITYATGPVNLQGKIGDIRVYDPHVRFTRGRPETAKCCSDVIPGKGSPYFLEQFDGGLTNRTEWEWVEGGFTTRLIHLRDILGPSYLYAPTEKEARHFLAITQNPSIVARVHARASARLKNLGLVYARS